MDAAELLERAGQMKATQGVMNNLRRNLGLYKSQKLSEAEIDEIINALTCEDDLVVERAGIKLLYMKITI